MKTKSTRLSVACSTALVLAAGSAASAQCTQQKLLADDRLSSDFLGGALAGYLDASNSAPRVMAGVGADDTAAGVNAGSVFTFGKLNNLWGQLSHFTANDGAANDFFGVSVGCSDPYAVIGATGRGDNGSVYFFQRFGPDWVQQTRFDMPGGQVGSDFGRSAAIDGEWAMVGAPLRDLETGPNNGFDDVNAGEVRIFRRNANGTWSNTQTEDYAFTGVMSGQATGDQFGSAVSMKNGWAIVGAPKADSINWPDDHGRCHVYRLSGSTWEYMNHVLPFSANENDQFGSAVSTDGVSFAIGCPNEDANANDLPDLGAKTDCGSVYVYYHQGSNDIYIQDRVFAQDASNNANFGSSVEVNGDTMVVGASGAKKAYIFKRDETGNWRQVSALADPDLASGSYASAVALSGNQVIVGDEGDEEIFSGLTNAGAAYAYTLPGSLAASDECAGANAIPGHGAYGGCTFAATSMGTTSCSDAGTGPDVWYSWTPTCSGTATINTNGSDYDTVLSVHSACPGGGGSNTIVCDDDSGDGSASSLSLPYAAGTTYLIRVAGYNHLVGNFILNINEGAVPSNDNCGAAATVVTTGITTFSTCRATDSTRTQSGCGPQGTFNNDVWFKFIAPVTGTGTVNLCGSTFDTKVAIYGAPLCPITDNTAIACNDDAPECPGSSLASLVEWPTQAGQDYYIRVGGYGSNMGDVMMSVTNFSECPCDWNGINGLSVQDIYDFLTSWSAGTGDFNQINGNTVQDIYDFLTCWSAGCN